MAVIATDSLPVFQQAKIVRGNSWVYTVEWQEVDLSSCEAVLSVIDAAGTVILRRSTQALDLALSVSWESGVPTTTIEATATSAQTTAIPTGIILPGSLELVIDYPIGARFAITRGQVLVLSQVTT